MTFGIKSLYSLYKKTKYNNIMKTFNFKNLSQQQEELLNKLLEAMIESMLADIDETAISSNTVSIATSKGDISLAQMKKEIEEQTPIGIEHLYMHFLTIKNIANIKLHQK